MRRLPCLLALAAAVMAACGEGEVSRQAGTPGGPPSRPPAAAGGSGSAGASTPASPPGASPAGTDPCAVGTQPGLPASIPATFPTTVRVAPDGRLFWSERDGRIEVWQDGAAHTVATLPTVTTEPGGAYSERGLLGLALSPSFATDHLIMVFVSDPDRTTQRVVRVHECRGAGDGMTTLVTLPAGGDCCHKGGRLAFGPDGMLYVTLGDEHTSSAAQDPGDVRGKVLRYRPDGTVPSDGPFGSGNPAFVIGLRNPFGIAFGPGGALALTVNGPSGDAGSPSTGYDTVVMAAARGSNRQWPLCYGYDHPLSGSCATGTGPDWSSESSTVVPTGAAFIDAQGPPALAGHLVICTFATGMLVATQSSPHTTMTAGPKGCRLDVTEATDHAVWVAQPGSIARV